MTDSLDCKAFLDFAENHGEAVACELIERVCEACYSDKSGDGVRLLDRHAHNVCNHTYSGEIDHNGVTYGFVIDDGDWNGTVIREWGLTEDVECYKPDPPVRYTLVPILLNKWSDPQGWKAYQKSRNEPWFEELLRGYLYDTHFAPGGATNRHYSARLRDRGLQLAEWSEYEALAKMPRPDWYREPKRMTPEEERELDQKLALSFIESLRGFLSATRG